jgi:hypothetical protein
MVFNGVPAGVSYAGNASAETGTYACGRRCQELFRARWVMPLRARVQDRVGVATDLYSSKPMSSGQQNQFAEVWLSPGSTNPTPDHRHSDRPRRCTQNASDSITQFFNEPQAVSHRCYRNIGAFRDDLTNANPDLCGGNEASTLPVTIHVKISNRLPVVVITQAIES